MDDIELPVPDPVRSDVLDWIRIHLADLCCDDVAASPAFSGGQTAADDALGDLDISGYARSRSMVDPPSARGASRLSPYIRHGLLDLMRVWDHVSDAPRYDRFRYQGQLLWQDYARHWYALYGTNTGRPIGYEPVRSTKPWPNEPWWREMACIDRTLAELETDGWCVNQTRMWLASQYSVRGHGDWRDGEDHLFAHLLDGSRAANRLGWQWCAGTNRQRAHGFARRQVTSRAPGFCASCRLQERCPIGGYARTAPRSRMERPPLLDPDVAYGPSTPPEIDDGAARPEIVWLTAESIGDADPALAANEDLPAWFIFDRRLLTRLALSSKRLVFLVETLAELNRRRAVRLWLGDPASVVAGTPAAVTYAPVPGFRRIAGRSNDLTLYPWPWLRPPTDELLEHLANNDRPPSFKDFCRTTRPEVAGA